MYLCSLRSVVSAIWNLASGGQALPSCATYEPWHFISISQYILLIFGWPQVWDDAMKAGCQVDCRMCTTLIEVCTRKGHTERALSMYGLMRDSEPSSKMAPSVHAYTAAMRAAAEGGLWQKSLEIWRDMQNANCMPSGMGFFDNINQAPCSEYSLLVLKGHPFPRTASLF